MLIGVDIDNVLAEFEAAFRGWINRHAGLALRRRDITRYRFAECCPLSEAEVDALFADFVRAGHLRRLSLIPHARAALSELAEGAEVCLVTSRPAEEQVISDTRFWLRAKGLPHSRLLWAERKWELAGDFSLFVEDSLEQARGLAERGVNVLLLDYPWNRDAAPHPRIRRVRSWRQAAGLARAPLSRG
jgi:5'(3')-deoxyribonucleotidase